MKAFVNSLSIFRIVAAFAIIPTLMYQWYWITFILYTLAAFSDLFDGILAKKYHVSSKLGGVLDHIGDKLLVANSMIMLAIIFHVWFVIIPVILMIARDLYVSGLREFMGTQKIEMPVTSPRMSMAKIKTFLQMVSVGAFFLLFAIGTFVTPQMTMESAGKLFIFSLLILPKIGFWGLWISLGASLWSGFMYTITFAKKFKK